MAPKMPKEYSDLRRSQILTATWELFAEKGYHETTMRDVAKKMGVSTGVIYKYFKGKEEITEGIAEMSNQSQAQLFAQIAQRDTARESMLDFIDAIFDCCTFAELRKSSIANINVWAEARDKPGFRTIVMQQFRKTHHNLAELIGSGVRRGELRDDLDPEALANFYITLIVGLQVQSALNDNIEFEPFYNGIKGILMKDIWRYE